MMKLVLCLLALIFTACEEPPTHGIVVDKHYKAAYTTHGVTRVGKTSVPTSTYHPEQWYLKLRDCDCKGKCRVGNRAVTHKDYDRFQVGIVYPEGTPPKAECP